MTDRLSFRTWVTLLLVTTVLFLIGVAGIPGRASEPAAGTGPNVIEATEFPLRTGESRSWTVDIADPPDGFAPALVFEARASGPAMTFNRSYSLEIRVNGKRVSSWQNRAWLRLRNRPVVTQTQRYGTLFAEQFLGWLVLAAPDFDSDPHAFSAAGNLGPDAFRYVIDLGGLVQTGPNTITFHHIRSSINLDTMYFRGLQMESVPAYVAPQGPAGSIRSRLILQPDGVVVSVAESPDTCVPLRCGDGLKELGEECDDGNTVPGDGCTATCLLEQP